MILCVLKQILHKKKSIFLQLLESPIPSLTTAALRIGVGDVCFFLTMRCFNDAMFSNS